MDTSRDVPLKDAAAGESYSDDEAAFLRSRWSSSDVETVVSWIATGADRDQMPACVQRVRSAAERQRGYDLRGIHLEGKLPESRGEDAPALPLEQARFECAKLDGVHLEYASLFNSHFAGASLVGAHLRGADLRWAHLEGANLSNAHLEQGKLSGAHLTGANLERARLDHANLRDAHLEGAALPEAHLEHAELINAHLRGARLVGAYVERADLRSAHLEQANLREAHFDFAFLPSAHLEKAQLTGAHFVSANLTGAHLENARLREADLTNADLQEANLEGATLIRTNILGANLSRVRLKETIFLDVVWRPAGWRQRLMRDTDPSHFEGFDVRGVRYSDPLFDQFVRQAEFIRGIRLTKPCFYWPWWASCYCGRSLMLWFVWCIVIIGMFGLIYRSGHLRGIDNVQFSSSGTQTVVRAEDGARWATIEPNDERQWTPTTPFYFSLVTFSTLGFGDVAPCTEHGEWLVMVEVFLGYIFLGGLMSIFAMKLLPPR